MVFLAIFGRTVRFASLTVDLRWKNFITPWTVFEPFVAVLQNVLLPYAVFQDFDIKIGVSLRDHIHLSVSSEAISFPYQEDQHWIVSDHTCWHKPLFPKSHRKLWLRILRPRVSILSLQWHQSRHTRKTLVYWYNSWTLHCVLSDFRSWYQSWSRLTVSRIKLLR